jgi:putative membrane protein
LNLSNLFVALVALLHVYFMILEMFLWTKPIGLKTFRITAEQAKLTAPLGANQGLYNGFLAAGLVWGLLQADPVSSQQIKVFFLVCVSVAGIFGALTANKKILFVQALPALIALGLTLLH